MADERIPTLHTALTVAAIVTSHIEPTHPGPDYLDRKARNALREQALDNPELLARVAKSMNAIEDVNLRLADARARLLAFIKAEGLEPIRYELERMCGMRQ